MAAFVTGMFSVLARARSSSLQLSSRSFLGAELVQRRLTRSRLIHSHVPRASAATEVSTSVENDLRAEFNKLFDETPCMPLIVRLAWHDAGTYDKSDNSGGATGTVRFKNEIGHGANAGLPKALDLLEPIKKKFPQVGYADFYQLASVQAIEYAGGPKIPFRFGREDGGEEQVTSDGRLPDGNQRMGHLRDVFYRMGFTDEEITALSGAHTLGRAHKERSGHEGPWTHEPIRFDNTYYKEILKDKPDPDLLRLESDLALLDQDNTRALVEKYAKDQSAFFEDYSKAHQKLSELGQFQN